MPVTQGLAPADPPATDAPWPYDREDEEDELAVFIGLRNAVYLLGGAAVVVVGLVALARGCAS